VVEVAPTAAAAAREAERLASQGRLEEAIAAYRRLLERSPDHPDCWYNLGLLQRRVGQFQDALTSYAQALRHGVRDPEEVHLNRAVILADGLHRETEAERELATALELNPAYLPALQNLANLHETLGRRAEARALYEQILSRWPYAFEPLARYATLCAAERDADLHRTLIARVRDALSHPAAGTADRASLGFALAKLLDGSGEYAAAFAAAAAANRASRAAARPAPYDRLAHERFIDALIAAFPAPAAAPAPLTEARRADVQEPRPIFICGMFRSGSTLTEQILAGHPQVAAGGELDILPRLVRQHLAPFPAPMNGTDAGLLDRVAAEYLRGLGRLYPDAASVTDKRPDNFLLIGLIKRLFPRARIVHTTRDALDTCLSIFFLHLDPHISWALDLDDIGHYFREYRRLMRHWRSLYGEHILDFDYDALVREPKPAARRLLAFCDLEWNETVLDFAARSASVRSASVWQVRETLHGHSSGRARHYGAELAALGAYLAEPPRG
jgi:tetratricopeptide (TPR) repeat protein